MSDDLAAKAANWVPPWQRPADGESDAESDAGAESDPGAEPAAEAAEAAEEPAAGAEARLPGQWDRLAGTKWQTARLAESDDESPEDEPGEDLSDPQLSDCLSEDEPSQQDRSADGLGAVALLSGDEDDQPLEESFQNDAELGAVALLSGDADSDDSDDADDADDADGFEGTADWASADPADAGLGQLFVPTQRVAEDRPALTEAELVPALEAILMVVDEPVGEITLAHVLEVPAEQVANALIDLSARYTEEGKGFDLRRAAGGWRFYTRTEYSSYVEKFVLDGQQLRLTQASLETLAVVAYKQPVTRSRISAIRGVNCDGVVRTLITRGLIEECGTEPESGAHLYRTTNLFLEKLGLDSVGQLPPLAPFLPDNLDEVAMNE